MERSSFCAFTEAFFYKLQVLFPEFSESIKRDKKGNIIDILYIL